MKNLAEYIQENLVNEGFLGFGGGSKHKRKELGWDEDNEALDVLGYLMFGYGTPKSKYFYKIANKEDKEKFYGKGGPMDKYYKACKYVFDNLSGKHLSTKKPVSIYISKNEEPKIKKYAKQGKFHILSSICAKLEYCSNPSKKLGKETAKWFPVNGWSKITAYEKGFAVIYHNDDHDRNDKEVPMVTFYVKFDKWSKDDK